MTDQQVKDAVRARDGCRCTKCGITAAEYETRRGRRLDVHRLVPGSPYTLEGCVTLCQRCHGPEPQRPHRSSDKVVLMLPLEGRAALRTVALEEGLTISDFALEVLATDPRFTEAIQRIRRKRTPPPAPEKEP